MTIKQPRNAQSQTATGKALAMTAAASTSYPAWPRELVDLPKRGRDRRRALAWYDRLSRHRTPAAWQASDAGRLAMLARTITAWERESGLLMEGQGGDANLSDKWRAAIAQLSRQLGLSVTVRDPRTMANEATTRAELQPIGQGDDLLARVN